MANAAAAVQLEDDGELADAEPWVLEGWGDGPSVSEVAQQAALRLGPYIKNVPTTLVGLGAGGGRRVLSAGHQSRGALKVSEARRKPGPGLVYAQGDRRSSGPAGLAAGGGGTVANLRRAAMQRTLDVGDESDVEPPPPPPAAAAAAGGRGTAAGSYSQVVMQAAPPAASRITPAQRAGALLRQQNAQNALVAATRLGRREAGAGAPAGAAPPPQAVLGSPPSLLGGGSAGAADSLHGGSPHLRSASAETYLPGGHGLGGVAAGAMTARIPNVSVRGVPVGPPLGSAASPVHPAAPSLAVQHGQPLLPPHMPLHLEPISTAPGGSRAGLGGRPAAGSSDSGLDPGPGPAADRPGSETHDVLQPPLSASFSSSQSPTLYDHHDPVLPSSAAAAAVATAAAASAVAASSGLSAAPPLLPGLLTLGRRGGSFRADGNGLSGWDPDGPAVVPQPHPGPPSSLAAPSNLSLWSALPETAASGAAGPLSHQVAGSAGTAAAAPSAASGRGSPLGSGQTPPLRRDGSITRVTRGSGGQTPGLVDVGMGLERSPGQATAPSGLPANSLTGNRAGRAGQLQLPQGALKFPGSPRSGSPDLAARGCAPAGFAAPQRDALTEFCASRAELSSAGAAIGSISGGAAAPPGTEGRGPGGGGGASGSSGVVAGLPMSVPLRVTSLSKATAVGRVS